MGNTMLLSFTPDGLGHCLHSELIDLTELGPISCRRASHIEFNEAEQKWEVLAADRENVLFSSHSRQTCLEWEQLNLDPA